MASNDTKPNVFLSHTAADATFAGEMETLLQSMDVACWNFSTQVQPGEQYIDKAQEALQNCTLIMVLVGPTTKDSKWVDMEMDVAMDARDSGPGAGVLGVILPTHEDFAKPYYDPERVPFRLHDYVRREIGIIKKWPDPATPAAMETVRSWLTEAEARRRKFQRKLRSPFPVLERAATQEWDENADVERPGLSTLSSLESIRSLSK
jgi:hypothetical protein